MKQISLAIAAFFLVSTGFAQKRYFTKTGTVYFEAGTVLEAIDGTNKSTTSVFDATTGDIQFGLLVKGFEFKSALMMEHFNENYMESDKFPKAVFTGKITNLSKIDFQKNGSYAVNVKGTIDIHGVKKEIETTGTFKVNGETVTANADFIITLEDFKIDIPGVVKDKISKTAKIKINCSYSILK